MTVLVVAEEYDPSADRVVCTLDERGVPVHRVDLAWFPGDLRLDAELVDGRWRGVLSSPGRATRLEDVRSVWMRSPRAFTLPAELTGAHRAHAAREARFGLGGVLATLPVRWVNSPQADADHAYKPRQLTLAASCGLAVPRTLVGNDPDAVRRFAGSCEHGAVLKTLAANVLDDSAGQRWVAHTHRLGAVDLADLSGVELTTHQVQEWVLKDHEARVIVVGEQLFAVGIRTDDPAAYIDWRADYDALTYESLAVPDAVAAGIRAFMAAAGLAFSALDFVITPGGQWVFLESNSTGQYGWLRPQLGTAVPDALADLLACGPAHLGRRS